jgi:hypothetical protein
VLALWSDEEVEDKGAVTSPGAPAPSGGHAPAGTPAALGPYAVTGRWHADATGQVLSGRDRAGREVELVLLAPGPGSDPAARDRFAAAAEDLAREHPGRLVDLDRGGPVAWAALASGSGPALARPLLAAAAPPGSGDAPAAGPDFSPHWTGSRSSYPVVPPPAVDPVPTPEGRQGWRRWWWVALVVALVLLLLLLLSACWPRAGEGPGPTPSTSGTSGSPTPSPSGAEPTPSPSGSGPSGPSGSGSPTPSNSAGAGPQTPEQPLAQGPGIGGEQFTEQDATTELRLAGLPFPFRVPDGWQCVRSVEEQDSVLYLCMDFEAVAQDPTRTAASGLVEVVACDGPCDPDEWALLRGLRSDDSGYVEVDAGTVVAEDADPYRDTFRRIRMSRVYDPAGGAEPTLHVYAEFTAPVDQYAEVRKVVDDIRVNTP